MSLFVNEAGLLLAHAWITLPMHAIPAPQCAETKTICATSELALKQKLFIGKNSDTGDRFRPDVLYRQPTDPAMDPEQAVFRIQGFVADANLHPIGDWNKRPENCMQATQWIKLGPGLFTNVFTEQQAAMDAICQFVRSALFVEKDNFLYTRDGAIYLNRLVFTKPRAGVTPLKWDTSADKTFFPALEKVKHDWVIASSTATYTRISDTRARPVSAAAIQKGDFVDVAIVADITAPHNTHRQRKVRLNLLRVVQLKARAIKQHHIFPAKSTDGGAQNEMHSEPRPLHAQSMDGLEDDEMEQ
ncbi:hypothetical protein EIP91_001800 [Steccherinum ochraceum]|uniref:Fungal-type protein kinase domain-containing protein n=1 Tax=Steccherinum ochraceum TaxID=92696 RepID=A0A4R0RXJ8_9APHY|nr:hypothetical protein EIP91_001800 [Steccherinum ochraceum]